MVTRDSFSCMSPHSAAAYAIPIGKSKIKNEQCLILNVSYRVPVESFIIEFPGGKKAADKLGCNDFGSIEKSAAEELVQETGFTGTVMKDIVTGMPKTFTDPWKSTDDTNFAFMDVFVHPKIHIS